AAKRLKRRDRIAHERIVQRRSLRRRKPREQPRFDASRNRRFREENYDRPQKKIVDWSFADTHTGGLQLMTRNSILFAGGLTLLLAAGPKMSAKEGDAAKGKETFEQCAVCHNVDTDEKKMGPSLKGLFKRKTMTNGKPMNDENVLNQINNGGNGLPAYSDMLSADDKANILAYLHTL